MLVFFVYLLCLDSNTLFGIPSNIKDKVATAASLRDDMKVLLYYAFFPDLNRQFEPVYDVLDLFFLERLSSEFTFVYSFCLMLADVFRYRYKDNENCDMPHYCLLSTSLNEHLIIYLLKGPYLYSKL